MPAQAKRAGRAKGTGPAKPAGPANQTAPAKQTKQTKQAKQTAPAKQAAPAEQTRPPEVPTALRLAAAAQAIEAVGLCIAAVFAAVSTADGKSYQTASGIALTLLAFGVAAGLVAIAAGLAKARPWSRTPAIMTQVFVVIAGITLLEGHRPEWGVPALLLSAVCVAGLLTPASLRALNRPPSTASNAKRQ